MFAYCTQVLRLSEPDAYLRISAARAARKHPMLLRCAAAAAPERDRAVGASPHGENREALFNRASHKSKRQIEELMAEIAPRPDVPSLMQRCPRRGPCPRPRSHSVRTEQGCRPGNSVQTELPRRSPSLTLRNRGSSSLHPSSPQSPACLPPSRCGRPPSNPGPPAGTRSSSRLARRFASSWSACSSALLRSQARRRSATSIEQAVSRRARAARGSGALPRHRCPARAYARPTPPPLRARSGRGATPCGSPRRRAGGSARGGDAPASPARYHHRRPSARETTA